LRLERTSQVAGENLLEGQRHNLYLLPSIESLMNIKSVRVRCAGLMAPMRGKKCIHNFSRKTWRKGRRRWEDISDFIRGI